MYRDFAETTNERSITYIDWAVWHCTNVSNMQTTSAEILQEITLPLVPSYESKNLFSILLSTLSASCLSTSFSPPPTAEENNI